jgi:hypothetical protein
MWVVIIREVIEQFGGEKTAVQGKKIVAQADKARSAVCGFEFCQGGEFFFA